MNNKNPITVLENEDFYWYKEHGGFVVNHPRWSTCGFGKTLKEAVSDCIDTCFIIRESYMSIDNKDLSQEAISLKNFLTPLRRS